MKKHLKNVGLLAIGIVVGVSISFAPEIQAVTSKLLGGKVEKVITVKKDGEVIGEGGIINGTTYLPVRTIVNTVDGIEVGKVSSSEVNLVSTEDPETSEPSTPVDLTEKARQEEEALKLQTEENNRKINDLRASIKEINKKINDATFKVNIEQSTSYKASKIYVDNYESGKGGSMREEDYNYYKSELDRMNKEKQEAESELPGLKSELSDLESQLDELLK